MFPEVESEMGLPLLITHALPVVVTGIVIASYFSAIMSTADSCLMASSGNFVNDVIARRLRRPLSDRAMMRLSQLVTLVIGLLAIIIASSFEKVLEAILFAYAFMVSGLFVPTLGAYFWKRSTSSGALWGMIAGGTATLLLQLGIAGLPPPLAGLGLDPSVYGILISAVTFVTVSLFTRPPAGPPTTEAIKTDV